MSSFRLGMESETDERQIIELELAALARELQYFLSQEVPTSWHDILRDIKKSVDLLHFNKNENVQESERSIEQLSFETDPNQAGSSVKGVLNIEGYKIVSGKLTIRMPKFNRGQVVLTSIVQADPFVIEQIQRCHHLAESAYKRLSIVDVQNCDRHSISTLIQVLEEAIGVIQQSREEIYLGSRNLLTNPNLAASALQGMGIPGSLLPAPSNMQQIQQSFHPQLPADIGVGFSVDDGKVIISVYGISYPQSAAQQAQSNTHLGASGKIIVQPHAMSPTALNKSAGYITEQMLIECETTFLSEALLSMSSAFKLCIRLRDKLLFHRQYL